MLAVTTRLYSEGAVMAASASGKVRQARAPGERLFNAGAVVDHLDDDLVGGRFDLD